MSATNLPPVLLLHGWGGSFAHTWASNGWEETLRHAGRRVLRMDLPGHGSATGSHDPADYADLASIIEERLGEEPRIDGIGFSLGAKLSLELACRRPRRFRRLVVAGLGQNAFAPEPLGDAVATALEHGCDADTPPAVAGLIERVRPAGNDPLALAACLRRAPNPILTAERLASVLCPVLLVAGDRDALAQPVAPLAAALAEAEVASISGVDHLGLPAAAELEEAALRFLSSPGD